MTNKQKLVQFIAKYNLGGTINSVKLKCNKKGKLTCEFVNPDSTNVGYVEMLGFDDFPKMEICIYNTNELLKILSIMENELKIKFVENDKKEISSVKIMDKKKRNVNFLLANLNAIEDAPTLSELPDFQTKIELTDEFITNFNKTHGALSDSSKTQFAIKKAKDNQVAIVMNYVKGQANNFITFASPTTQNGLDVEEDEQLVFDADFFKTVLNANKNVSGGVFDVSNDGFGRISYNTEDFNGNYYLIGIE